MNKITLTNDQLKRVFEVAQSTIAKDATRPILQYAKATVKGSELTVVACDGWRLSRYKLELKGQEADFGFYFKPFALPKTLISAEIEKLDDKVIFTLNCSEWQQSYIFPQPSGDFIDADKIIPPRTENLAISFNAKGLMDALKPFAKNSDRHHIVKLNFVPVNSGGINAMSPGTLTGKIDDANVEILVLPVRCTD